MKRHISTEIIVLTLLLFISHDSVYAASSKWYDAKQVKFEIKIPTKSTKNWLIGPLMGFPMAILAPNEGGYRPTLSLTPESVPSHDPITFDQVQQSIGFYKNGRKNYVSARKGSIEKFFEPQKVKNENNLEIFSMGYIYTINDLKIVEKSLRFMCDGHIILGMARYYPKYHKHAELDFSKILKSLNCKKNSGGQS